MIDSVISIWKIYAFSFCFHSFFILQFKDKYITPYSWINPMQFLHQPIPAVPSPCPPPGWSRDISIFLALDGKFPWRWGLLSSAGIDWCIVISFRKRVLWTALYPESFDLLLIVTGITGVLWENNILITVTQPLRRAKLRLNPCYAMQGPRSHGNMGEFSDRCQVTLMEALLE